MASGGDASVVYAFNSETNRAFCNKGKDPTLHNCFGRYLGIGTRIIGCNNHRGWNNIWKLGNRKADNGKQSQQCNENRNHY